MLKINDNNSELKWVFSFHLFWIWVDHCYWIFFTLAILLFSNFCIWIVQKSLFYLVNAYIEFHKSVQTQVEIYKSLEEDIVGGIYWNLVYWSSNTETHNMPGGSFSIGSVQLRNPSKEEFRKWKRGLRVALENFSRIGATGKNKLGSRHCCGACSRSWRWYHANSRGFDHVIAWQQHAETGESVGMFLWKSWACWEWYTLYERNGDSAVAVYHKKSDRDFVPSLSSPTGFIHSVDYKQTMYAPIGRRKVPFNSEKVVTLNVKGFRGPNCNIHHPSWCRSSPSAFMPNKKVSTFPRGSNPKSGSVISRADGEPPSYPKNRRLFSQYTHTSFGSEGHSQAYLVGRVDIVFPALTH